MSCESILDLNKNTVLYNPRLSSEEKVKFDQLSAEVVKNFVVEPSFIVASSGTTSANWQGQKLVVIPKKNFLLAAKSTSVFLEMSSNDIIIESLPRFHVGGLGMIARSYVSGASFVENNKTWEASQFYELAEKNKGTLVSLVPTQLYDLIELNKSPWKSLRTVVVGGAFLDDYIQKKAIELGWPLLLTYGMTETSAFFSVRSPTENCYKILPHMEVQISETKRIKLKSQALALGYARQVENKTMWTQLVNENGWYESEDHGELVDGRINLLGRANDIVKVKGELVLLNILRNKFVQHFSGHNDHHIFSIPHQRDGMELIVAVKKNSLTDEQLDEFNKKLLPFERVKKIEVNEIPRNLLGKVLEKQLIEIIINLNMNGKMSVPYRDE